MPDFIFELRPEGRIIRQQEFPFLELRVFIDDEEYPECARSTYSVNNGYELGGHKFISVCSLKYNSGNNLTLIMDKAGDWLVEELKKGTVLLK
mgnify:CR=1 FL=1